MLKLNGTVLELAKFPNGETLVDGDGIALSWQNRTP